MNPAYKDDAALCQWLLDNSSGVYRLAGHAAQRIADLKKQLESTNREFEALSKRLKETVVSKAEWEPLQKEWFGDKYAAMQPVDAIRAMCSDQRDRIEELERLIGSSKGPSERLKLVAAKWGVG